MAASDGEAPMPAERSAMRSRPLEGSSPRELAPGRGPDPEALQHDPSPWFPFFGEHRPTGRRREQPLFISLCTYPCTSACDRIRHA